MKFICLLKSVCFLMDRNCYVVKSYIPSNLLAILICFHQHFQFNRDFSFRTESLHHFKRRIKDGMPSGPDYVLYLLDILSTYPSKYFIVFIQTTFWDFILEINFIGTKMFLQKRRRRRRRSRNYLCSANVGTFFPQKKKLVSFLKIE